VKESVTDFRQDTNTGALIRVRPRKKSWMEEKINKLTQRVEALENKLEKMEKKP